MTDQLAAPDGGPVSAKGEPAQGEPTPGEGSLGDGPSPTFIDSVTPSGIEVRYYTENKELKIKRHYELRRVAGENATEWEEVPSVTTVLEVLHKPGLTSWGMKVGVKGVFSLLGLGLIDDLTTADPEDFYRSKTDARISGKPWGLLQQHSLDVNKVRDKAGDRGTAVHNAFENWCRYGHVPNPSEFPEEEAGYVAGIVKFLRDVEPEPQAAEVMVGSLEHGYAGRYDARLYVPRKCEVVYKHTPKRGDHRAVLAPGTILCDLKTSSGVYPSHSRQLEAYEQASIECGYGPSDARGILHVTSEGDYEFVRSTAVFEDFRVVLDVWKSEQAMKKRKR